MSRVIHGIHISDTHVGPGVDFEYREGRPYERFVRLLNAIGELDFVPDFVVHTGDIVNHPDAAAYRLAAGHLSEFSCPFYPVVGNHDDAAMMAGVIPLGNHQRLVNSPDRLCYRFSLPGLNGFVLDAKVLDSDDPSGRLPEDQIDALKRCLGEDESPFAVFIHFPPLPVQSAWMDAHLLLRNGEVLHDLLRNQDRERVRGVFFGHLHRGMQLYRDGILYSGVGSPVWEFSAGPADTKVDFNPDAPVPFH